MSKIEFDPDEAPEEELGGEEVPEEVEQSDEASDDGGSAPSPEAEERFKITIEGDSGDEEVEVTKKELTRMFGRKDLPENVVEMMEFAQETGQLLNGSELAQMVMYYKSIGKSDQEIADGLQGAWRQHKNIAPPVEEEEPEFETQDERVKWLVAKSIAEFKKEQLDPFIQSQRITEQKRTSDKIRRHNDEMFEVALNKKFGISTKDLDEEDINRVIDTYKILYSNVDIDQHQLSQPVAHIIIKDALGPKYGKGKSAARVQPRTATEKMLPKTVQGRPTQPRDGISAPKQAKNETERANNWLNYLNNQK